MEELFGDDTSTGAEDLTSNAYTGYPSIYPPSNSPLFGSTPQPQPDSLQSTGGLRDDDECAKETSPVTEKSSDPQDAIVGIDLGTTFSCVAVWENGRAVVVANNMGNRTTPSWVCFHKEGTFVGEAAQKKGTRFPKLAIFDAKRMIGRKVGSTRQLTLCCNIVC